uniref:Restriction endonuclease HNH n=1 Tax=Clandestinovirus TaxID=2831644 RepID=A0A8F8PK61_9VIRU|nr:restriction endonuclease HNH [Clandestinovirus]
MTRSKIRRPDTAKRQAIFHRLFFIEDKQYDEAKRQAEEQVPYTDDLKDVKAMRTWYCTQKKKKAGTYKPPVLTAEAREKKRANDRRPEVILEHCIANKQRRLKNPEHVREVERRSRARNPVTRKLTNFLSDSKVGKARPILVDENTIKELYKSCCAYCGTDKSQRSLGVMGIDRVDNDKFYDYGNIVPCCYYCNRLKRDLAVNEFVDRCKVVAVNAPCINNQRVDIPVKVLQQKYDKCCKNATTREIQMSLSQDECCDIFKSHCHYCGKQPSIECPSGIDRKDSDGHYTIDNVVPSCWPCNHMKSDIPYDHFIEKCNEILKHNKVV